MKLSAQRRHGYDSTVQADGASYELYLGRI